MTAPNEPLAFEIIRTLPVTPDEAFAAWTDPGQMAQWWGTPDHPGTGAGYQAGWEETFGRFASRLVQAGA